MDKATLGRRLAQAREDAGMTQESLARAVGLDRTAVTRLEKGERKLSVPELVTIADKLGRPLSFFTQEPVAAAVSRRSDVAHAHETTRVLDVELESFAADVRSLLDLGLMEPVERPVDARTPKNHSAAENMAVSVRKKLGIGHEPVDDLGRACEALGLATFSASLGADGPDGGCVEVTAASSTLGAAVVNGDRPSGRRRMTLAHELGHWLCGDAYDQEASDESERMISSFAVHFLAPRAGVQATWNSHPDRTSRDRAIAVSVSFRLSWSAAIGQLRNLGLVSGESWDRLSAQEPTKGDYLRLALSWTDELQPRYLSPGFSTSCVLGYVNGKLTAARTLELLRGTLTHADLPEQDRPTLDDMRRHFAGHDF